MLYRLTGSGQAGNQGDPGPDFREDSKKTCDGGAELAGGFEEVAWESNGAVFLNLPARPQWERRYGRSRKLS